MLIHTTSLLARHLGAAFFTLGAVTLGWIAVWTGFCFVLMLLGNMSLGLYIAGALLVLLGVVPALVFPVVPAVLIAERATRQLGKARYVAQLPIVAGLSFLGVIILAALGLLGSLVLGSLPLAYLGLAAIMALPVAGVYWLTAKVIEVGIDSVKQTLTLILAGLRGAIDLAAYLRQGLVVKRQPGSTPDSANAQPTGQRPDNEWDTRSNAEAQTTTGALNPADTTDNKPSNGPTTPAP
jgi:hypothetical protein